MREPYRWECPNCGGVDIEIVSFTIQYEDGNGIPLLSNGWSHLNAEADVAEIRNIFAACLHCGETGDESYFYAGDSEDEVP